MTDEPDTTVSQDVDTERDTEQHLVQDVLVEEVSIDGMCGVY